MAYIKLRIQTFAEIILGKSMAIMLKLQPGYPTYPMGYRLMVE